MRRTTALIAAAVAAALLGAAACSPDQSVLPDKPGPDVAVTLDATLTRDASSLTWTWKLRNDEPGQVAVFSGSSADIDGGVSNGTGAWVVPRDDKTIEVAQRLLAQPPGVGLARPYSQWGTLIPAGSTLTGSARVKLPLRVQHPYAEFFKPPLKLPADAEKVVFCIGVGRAQNYPPVSPEPSAGPRSAAPDGPAPAGARKARFVHGGGSSQHLACTPAQDL